MNKEKLKQDIDAMREKLAERDELIKCAIELRKWVADGEFSDDGGIFPNCATKEYKEAVQKFDEWFKTPYTKVLQDSIKNDYVPKADQSEYIKRLEDALTASLALNINWSSEAETEMLSYFNEYKDVIKQAKETLASKESIDG